MSQGRRPVEQQESFIVPSHAYSHIPKSNFYERLQNMLDLEFVYELTKPLYDSTLGRPSLDPVIFFKSMMVMLFENILYFEQLEFRLADSLTFRHFIRYRLDERVPDESTLRKTFHIMPIEAFSAVFDYVIDICEAHKMIKGVGISTDSTLIEANASMDSLVHKELGCSSRDFFVALRKREQEQETTDEQDTDAGGDQGSGQSRDAKASSQPKGSKSKALANEIWVSRTDPEARVMSPRDKRTDMYYRGDVCVDMDTGIILSAGAEVADIVDRTDFLIRTDEALMMLRERGYDPSICVADSGHLSGPNLVALDESGLCSVITDRPQNYHWVPGFARDDFKYIPNRDVMVCPEGNELVFRYRGKDHTVYKCPGAICRICPHFGVCTTNRKGRTVRMNDYQDYIQANAERANSEWGRALRWSRMQRGEAPFAFLKSFGGLRRLSCRGLDYANKKMVLGSACWNLIRVIKVLMGCSARNSVSVGLFGLLLRALGWLSRPSRPRLTGYTQYLVNLADVAI